MGDVDVLQVQQEAAAQREQQQQADRRESQRRELREAPMRATAGKTRHARELPLACVHPGDNIRLDLPEIQELALSIRELGLLSPLIVRPWNTAADGADGDGELPAGADPSVEHYRLIAGHRRHAALTLLVEAEIDGFDSVTCEVREGLTESEAYALMLTENVQRIPLEPVQAARALRLLLDLNPELSAARLARSLGLRPAWAQTHLKLLDLPQVVQDRIEAGDLSVTIADLLRRGTSAGRIDEGRMIDIAQKIANGEITVAQAKAEAGPPRKPNTVEPKTVRRGNESDSFTPRPPTPLSDESPRPFTREPGPAPGSALPRIQAAADTRDGAFSTEPDDRPAAGSHDSELSYDEQLDAYLLGRALREWASDEYLDDIGIDRVSTDAWARALEFDERIGAIRDLSLQLMRADHALASV